MQLSMKDFTVFITFHQANSIARKFMFHCCVKSALAQGCNTVLIHDNKSNQEEIDYAEKNGIKLHEMEDIGDTGFSKFLKAFELCNTKYLSLVQDDDYYEYNKTQVIISSLNHLKREFSLITTDLNIISDGIIKSQVGCEYGYLQPPSKWVINKELIKTIDPIPECPFAWDRMIAYQFLSKGDILHIKKPLTYYNFHDEQETNAIDSEKKWKDFDLTNNYVKTMKFHKVYILNDNQIVIKKPKWLNGMNPFLMKHLQKVLDYIGVR